MKAILESSKSGIARVRANSIARLYGHLLEASHNGFRYSMVAANKNKITDLAELASKARRLSVDSAQHGGLDGFNKIVGSLNYANLSIQTMAAAAQRIKQNPMAFAGNFGSFALPVIAMHYIALATLDHVTGAHDGNWNGDVIKALGTWLDGDCDEDAYNEDWNDMMSDNIRSNIPIGMDAVPLAPGLLASVGIDPGMSRASGTPVEVRTQKETGFQPEMARPNSLTIAMAENIIVALTGSFGQNMVGIANDTYRGMYASDDVAKAVEMGASRYASGLARGAGPLRPLLFGNRDNTISVADTNWQMLNGKQKGIDTALGILDRDISTGGIATSKAVKTRGATITDSPELREEVSGTQNEYIAGMAGLLRKNAEIRSIDTQLRALTEQQEGVRNGYVTSDEVKSGKINEIVERRKYFNLLKLEVVRQYEHDIRERIGDPDFSFDTYDPEDYKEPLQ
jgi:hypothetical protein